MTVHIPVSKLAQERVNRGVVFLNERFPGWLWKIDLENLDISCFSWCLMGQLVGGYEKASDILGTNGGVRLGFDGSDLWINNELTAAWKERILELRAARSEHKEAA